MLIDENEIIQLIEKGHESDFLDFKKEHYTKEKHDDLLKDIMAMANSKYIGNKYIFVGIKEILKENRKIIFGIENNIDSSTFHQLILNNIEPEIKFNFIPFDYDNTIVGLFVIFENKNQPYMLKKKYGLLHLH